MDNKTILFTPAEACAYLNISRATLNRWQKNGKLTPVYTSGGHRRFERENLLSCLGTKPAIRKKITVGYCRVSTSGQKNDLERQVSVVTNYCEKNGYSFRVIKDIGSGINYNRKGFQELLTLICHDECERIVVNYKDRLARFGLEMLETICQEHGVVIEIINQTEDTSYESELVEDVLTIITVFSARLYGKRSHKNKRIVEENKMLFGKGHYVKEEKEDPVIPEEEPDK